MTAREKVWRLKEQGGDCKGEIGTALRQRQRQWFIECGGQAQTILIWGEHKNLCIWLSWGIHLHSLQAWRLHPPPQSHPLSNPFPFYTWSNGHLRAFLTRAGLESALCSSGSFSLSSLRSDLGSGSSVSAEVPRIPPPLPPSSYSTPPITQRSHHPD